MASIVGTHCILDLYECPADLLNDRSFIEQTLRDAAKQGLATLLQEISHQFNPHGVTALGLLAESHLSIHTWPEHCYAAVDIFTCGQDAKPEQACLFMVDRLQAKRHSLNTIARGSEALLPHRTQSVISTE
jgi:S-adenosylmethionine decarboxylase